MKISGTLKCWSVAMDWSPYQAPEMRSQFLSGDVYGRAGFSDGDRVTTSSLKKVERIDGELYGFTANSIYKLEDVDPAYEQMFPDVIERLLKSSAIVNAE